MGARRVQDALNLPSPLEPESREAILRVHAKIGSIRLCRGLEDFGLYRMQLVEEFNEEIRKLKRTV